MKESFVFFKSWKDAINGLPPDVRLEIYEAVVEYGTLGNVPDLKPMAAIAFNFIKNDLDRSAEKYAKIVERNKTNGKKGGRPKNPENPVGFSETQEKHNKDDNEYDDDNDILLGKESKVENQDFLSSQDNLNPKHPEGPAEGKEKSSAKKESEKFFSKRDFKKRLIELGAENEHVDDWFKVRDKKRASYTETALNGLVSECEKYSYPVKEAVKICAERSWQGFKYSWLDNKQTQNGNQQRATRNR